MAQPDLVRIWLTARGVIGGWVLRGLRLLACFLPDARALGGEATTAVLGRDDTLQVSLSPWAWFYVGDLSDNPDIKDYRGYADLRATVGWARGLQLGATGRLGDDADHGSLQLDLTYPMMHLLSGSFSVCLQAQYFTGYGESLLLYNQRSDAFRAGFASYR